MTVALVVSRILDPMWVIPAVTLVKTAPLGFLFSLILMLLMLGIPFILRFHFRKHDWDIKKRKDRPQIIAVLLLLGCITMIFSLIFGNTEMTTLLLFYEVWLLGFLCISLFYKISGHVGGMALGTGLLLSWYGIAWWPMLLLIPIVGWARVITKNHTIAQVIVGGLYSWILLVVFTSFL